MSDPTPNPPFTVPAPSSPSVAAPTSGRRHVRRGLVVAVALTAVVGASGFGVGVAATRRATTTTTSTATPTAPQTWGGHQPDQGYGGSFPDQQDQGPQQDGQLGGQPNTGTTSRASGAQLTGLVRIVSTMGYAGGTGVGTGMVLTPDGEVVTNHHVVAGATKIRVTVMSTDTTYTARVVGTDGADDVAVLQLEGASGLRTVKADSDGVTVDEAVTAVGDGEGARFLSAATGTVMATDQQITTEDEANVAGERLTGLIEISSDVVPGYSGGATYDADGEVVGMTTAASTGNGSDTTGYAVPIATVMSIVDDLEGGVRKADYDYGYPAFLGIGLGESGTTVANVYDGTPAAGAGITTGDAITRVDGRRVTTSQQLRAAISAHAPGDGVRVTWADADGTAHVASVTLARGPVA